MCVRCAFFITKYKIFSVGLSSQVTAKYIPNGVQQIFLFLRVNQPHNSKLSLVLYVCFSKDWVKLKSVRISAHWKVKSTVKSVSTDPIPISMHRQIWLYRTSGEYNIGCNFGFPQVP